MSRKINPCPNLSCAKPMADLVGSHGFKDWRVECNTCGYSGPHANSKSAAVVLHNIIAPARWMSVKKKPPTVPCAVDVVFHDGTVLCGISWFPSEGFMCRGTGFRDVALWRPASFRRALEPGTDRGGKTS